MGVYKTPNKFLSHDIYASCLDPNHFLVQLNRLFDWYALAEPLLSLAKNDHGGRPRHHPVVMLKMLFVSFLFDQSDRDIETLCRENIPVKYFLGLPINEDAPDASCLCDFRNEILRVKGGGFFRELFVEILAQAKQKGVSFGMVKTLDSTHTIADVNTPKDGAQSKHLDLPARDPDAAWGVKGHEVKMSVEGKQVTVLKSFYGYKAHLLAETDHELVTGFHVTHAATSDLDGGDVLLHRILTGHERLEIHVLLADKAYGCPVWINMLEKHDGIMTAFHLPKTMLEKGAHTAKWRAYLLDAGRTAFRQDRRIIERVNGDLKDNHGLRRCRYLGLTKYLLQTAMACIAHNVKKIVPLLTGSRFRPAC